MDGMKKFLRYVVPGLVVVVEFSLLLGLLLFFKDVPLLKQCLQRAVKLGDGVGGAISLFLLSGGLGALLATLYHLIISTCFVDRFNVDYSQLLKFFEENNIVQFRSWDDQKIVSYKRLNKVGQWRVLTALWHGCTGESEVLKQAERRAETLHDIAHSLGTQLIGAFLVIIMIVLFEMYYSLHFGWFYVVPVFLFYIHFLAFEKVIRSIQNVMSNIYVKEFGNTTSTPHVLRVCQSDMKRCCHKQQSVEITHG